MFPVKHYKIGGLLKMKEILKVRYDSRKSFYGKAQIEKIGNAVILYSYGTKVAEIKNGKAKVFGFYSLTTLRHIKEFLKQNGFEAESKSQILKDYFVEE
jgi:hypothetical protein